MRLKSTCFILLFSLYRSILTAAPPSLSPLTIFNITVPQQDTPITPSLSVRPPDPFDITSDWEGPGFITLTFSNYGGDIPRQLARYCTSLAIDDADSHASLTVWNQPIGKSELLYANTQTPTAVILGVLPRPLMTWNMFHYAMLSVHQFTTNFESMAFEFEVEMTGLQGLAASGNLSILPELGSSF